MMKIYIRRSKKTDRVDLGKGNFLEYAILDDPGQIGSVESGYLVDIHTNINWSEQICFRGINDSYNLNNKYLLVLVN